jgi:hypothetical protein
MSKSKRPVHPAPRQSTSWFASLSPTTQDLLCVLFLYAVALFLFRGIIFDNAAFSSENDTAASVSYAHAGDAIKAAEGVAPLWMPYFFSGMPTFGNVAYVPHDVSYIQKAVVGTLNLFFLNGKWTWLIVFYFLGGVFTFLLLRVWKFSRTAALLAALTFMLSPYAIGLAGEGHGSKLMALSYIPLVFLLTHVLFERRDLLSFGLLAAGVGTLLLTNHMQIVYYAFILIGLYAVYTVALDAKQHPRRAATIAGLFLGALAIGFCISSYIYLSVYEYAQYSIRGGGTTGATGGLTWDYATNWSWNPWEAFTLLIPSFFGYETPYYWGTMPFTNATVYVGIVPLLLSAVAIIYRRNRLTVFLIIVTAIAFLMSFGKHFAVLYQMLFSVLPFFNKFRAPAMILHLLPLTLGFLAATGYSVLIEERAKLAGVDRFARVLLYALGGLIGLMVLGMVMKPSLFESLSGFMFVKDGEVEQYRQQYGQQVQRAIAQLKQTRFEMLWKDFVKFVVIAAASLGLVWVFVKQKVGAGVFGTALIGILMIDLFIMDFKYITPKPSAVLEQNFRPDATVAFLKEQPGLFRVFPVGQMFADLTFAYHGIQSIGGYSPAKLKIYQTMLDSCLYEGADPSFPLNMNIVNMLNARYIVVQGRLPEDRFELVNADQAKRELTYKNPHALPRAFFVDSVVTARDNQGVFRELNAPSFDAAHTAVLFETAPEGIRRPDSTSVDVTEFRAHRVVLRAYTDAPALLVVSEVYYPAGWKATIDGAATPILRTNYVLRSVVVPAGSHEVVFSFEPPMYQLGWILSNAGWGVAAVCILGGLWSLPAVRRRTRRDKGAAPDRAS